MYYLELNGKPLDLSTVISSYIIPSTSVLVLKMRANGVSNKLNRVAIQYNDSRSSVGVCLRFMLRNPTTAILHYEPC